MISVQTVCYCLLSLYNPCLLCFDVLTSNQFFIIKYTDKLTILIKNSSINEQHIYAPLVCRFTNIKFQISWTSFKQYSIAYRLICKLVSKGLNIIVLIFAVTLMVPQLWLGIVVLHFTRPAMVPSYLRFFKLFFWFFVLTRYSLNIINVIFGKFGPSYGWHRFVITRQMITTHVIEK